VPSNFAFSFNLRRYIKGSLAPLPTDYSPEWRTLVRGMLNKNPSERPELSQLLEMDFLKDTVRLVKVGRFRLTV
jgi:hypothetical protein